MSEEVRLVRRDETPWGFRLTGGRDFGIPLTIIKITGGSIAEEGGLRVDDIITEINETKASNLTHAEAQKCIINAKNFLNFKLLRGSHVAPPPLTPIRNFNTPCSLERRTPCSFSTDSLNSITCEYEIISNTGQVIYEECDENNEELTEDDIASMLLENAEVMEEKGKNVIGVNFHRFIPKCDFIKDSAVFQVLQEEQVYKEMTEKEQLARNPNKKFSTFLSTPDRPKVQPKPKSLPKSKEVEIQNIPSVQQEEHREEVTQLQYEKEENKVDIETENGIKNEIPVEKTLIDDINVEDSKETEIEENEECLENEDSDRKNDDSALTEETCDNVEINEEEGEFYDKELENIKDKLNMLQHLPDMIQSHLTEVQQQINKLLTKKHKTQDSTQMSNEEKKLQENGDVKITEEENAILEEEQIVNGEQDVNGERNVDEEEDQNVNDDKSGHNGTTEENFEETEPSTHELGNNHEDFENPKPKERPVCPLTPLPRPMILPGGRKWRKPKDAFNEKFIAETLISQAEVLVGSTLGVNFRKYEPPKFDVSNSAVYKLIHNIESKSKGLENRPEKVPAEQDYYQSPISARHFYCASLSLKEDEETQYTDL